MLSTSFKFEQEKWYEAIRNSRRTIKEIKNSISKKPKNVANLLYLLEKEGEDKISELANKRKEQCIKFFTKM